MTAELPRMSLPSHATVRSYSMDSNVANHLVQTVEASRLLGAAVTVTGMSPEITQTLVTLGVDPGKTPSATCKTASRKRSTCSGSRWLRSRRRSRKRNRGRQRWRCRSASKASI